ncbi:unnamed protein product [Caenorhabditis auriculariae]|uniref:Bestrophin homolog n=1 Tax=Caenorhabditis auriculariae TaxID=2777116 RepID=A0A8S1HVP3_9PELO|nr:unnamed protein product [Caenorhabditis auriculariae]
MTVTYSLDVATSTFFTQMKVLFRWKGSVWKAVWIELLVWLSMYFTLSIAYRVFMSKAQRAQFEELCKFLDTFSAFIPVTFMLGFYVTAVYNRWTNVFANVGWIDAAALSVAQYIRSPCEKARNIRRSIIRYLIVAQTLVYRDVSPAVRRRFPTLRHLVTSGLLREDELAEFDSVVSRPAKYWQPVQWIFCYINMARDEGFIRDSYLYIDLNAKIEKFRGHLLALVQFDFVPMPLVYTQVVTLAVRSYFFIALFGRQFLDPTRSSRPIDLYFPIFSTLQIIFIVGWLKVSEVMLNPLGEDDEDFETNWIIDRNIQIGYAAVDQAYDKCPKLARDSFWGEDQPEPLYTADAAEHRNANFEGSCAAMNFDPDEGIFSRIRRRSLRPSDADSVDTAITVPTVLTKTSKSYNPSGERLQLETKVKRLSDVFDKFMAERRNSVCLAALDLNRQREPSPEADEKEEEVLDLRLKKVEPDSTQVEEEQKEDSSREKPRSWRSSTAPSVAVEIPEPSNSEESNQSTIILPQGTRKTPVTWFVDEMPTIEEEEQRRRSFTKGMDKDGKTGKTSPTKKDD